MLTRHDCSYDFGLSVDTRVLFTDSGASRLGERIQKCACQITRDEAETKMGNTAPWGHGGGTGVFLKWMVSARVRARTIRYKPSHINCHSRNDNGLRFAASETKRRV